MPPRIAFIATLLLAVIGGCAMVPLLGLFTQSPAPVGTAQTWLAILVLVALITAPILLEYCGNSRLPASVRRLLNTLLVIFLLLVWLPQLMGLLRVATGWTWLDRFDDPVIAALLFHVPLELTLILPAAIAGAAIWRYGPNRTNAA